MLNKLFEVWEVCLIETPIKRVWVRPVDIPEKSLGVELRVEEDKNIADLSPYDKYKPL